MRRATVTRRAAVACRSTILAAVLLGLCLPAAAASTPAPPVAHATAAAPPARLGAAFVPERLGRATTLEFSFSLAAPAGQVPPPLTQIQLRYPDNLGLGLSGLGLATCTAATLEAWGPSRCPPDAVMGYGAAFTGIVLGRTIIAESAPITILRSPTSKAIWRCCSSRKGPRR